MSERKNGGPEYEAEETRQGYIVLRSRRRKAIFIAGLVGFVVLAVLMAVLAPM